MRSLRAFGFALLLLLLAGPASGQGGPSRAIEKGRWSIAFTLPEGGGSAIGVWKMISSRTNLGVNLGIGHQFDLRTSGPDSARRESGGTFWRFSIEPTIKRYLILRESVSPFVLGALKGSYGWIDYGNHEEFSRSATLSAGLGVDWSPLRAMSIGASTGIEWTESMTSVNDYEAPKFRVSEFNTATTALILQLYF